MKKCLILVLCLLSLAGCSQRLAYNNLGWLASYYVSDYVDLTDEQEEKLESDVESLVAWHRESELPKYKAHIKTLLKHWHMMSESDMVHMVYTTRNYWYSVVKAVYPKLQPHLSSLNREQRESLIENLEEELLDDDWEEGDQFDRYERWLGKVTDAQKALINEYYEQGEFARQVWRAHEQRRFNQFKQALLLSSEGKISDVLLQKAIVTNPSDLPARIIEIQERRIREYAALAVKLKGTMSNKQKVHFKDELEDLLELLESL
ncbi:DUF6279 family lipoprotein [Pseudoalteromonas piscicida]|uniref:DUF6279 family lipoprotein n=1 Tax=Pseudoalteromonas piscicida TaxID=43662 RepID=UPI0030A7AD79